jgi:hypothetical protein
MPMKYLLSQRTVLKWSEADLKTIEAAMDFVQNPPTAGFFPALALLLHQATGAEMVTAGWTVTEDKKYVQTLGFTQGATVLDNITYCTVGAPCENVLGHNFCYYPENIQGLFPEDEFLKVLDLHCYMGLPLNDRDDNTIGLLSLLHRQDLANPALAEHLLFVLAAVAEENLQKLLVAGTLSRN